MTRSQSLAAASALAALLSFASTARADYTLTFPQADGTFGFSGFTPQTVGTGTLATPAGQTIASATLSGTFGSTTDFVNGGTAPFSLQVDGTTIGSTGALVMGVPFSFTIAPSLLVGSTISLGYTQTSLGIVHLSQTALVITTAAVPEPSSLVLGAVGLTTLGVLRPLRRRASRVSVAA